MGETTEVESLDEKPYYAAAEFDVVKTSKTSFSNDYYYVAALKIQKYRGNCNL